MKKVKVESNPNILGGTLVFKGTRLSVEHIGKILAKGESRERILEEYPYLTQRHLDFALKLYNENK